MPPPLRCCLLSGGESRRMGRDKALLPHPQGGTWLERTLRLLATLEAPITLLSRHPEHLALAERLGQELGQARGSSEPPHDQLMALAEPPPWEGPLRALQRLMEHHPGERLLLCPVDMPWLDPASLRELVCAAEGTGEAGRDGAAGAVPGGGEASGSQRILLAHDGQRLQPLLGIYPASEERRQRLAAALAAGERGLQRWLAGETWRPVPLAAAALRNINRPAELPEGQ